MLFLYHFFMKNSHERPYIGFECSTLDLPIPHTDKISNFSKVAGVENLDSLRKSG